VFSVLSFYTYKQIKTEVTIRCELARPVACLRTCDMRVRSIGRMMTVGNKLPKCNLDFRGNETRPPHEKPPN
jgi:hypothetical protein